MNFIDIKDWIDKFFDQGVKVDEKTLKEIEKFTVVWLIFEKYICEEEASLSKLDLVVDKVNENNIDNAIYQETLEYFQNRYINDQGNTNEYFKGIFRSHENRYETICTNVLKGNFNSKKEILKGLIFLVYRYRNNLFHGVKDVLRLDDQFENFIHINIFLQNIACYLKKELNIETT